MLNKLNRSQLGWIIGIAVFLVAGFVIYRITPKATNRGSNGVPTKLAAPIGT